MLKDVPTEEAPMRVMWAKVLRMLDVYRKSVKTEQKHGEFDRLWSTFPYVRNFNFPSKSTLLRYSVISDAFPL